MIFFFGIFKISRSHIFCVAVGKKNDMPLNSYTNTICDQASRTCIFPALFIAQSKRY